MSTFINEYIYRFPFLVIVDSEFRSLLRSFLEKIALRTFFKNLGRNDFEKDIISVSLRVTASLISVYLLENFKSIRDFKKSFSVLFLSFFVLYSIYNFFEINKSKKIKKVSQVLKNSINDVKDNYQLF